ncbi:DUF2971 domain-containing protein [Rhodoferax sp. BLA1]|uniref:DUF2971 domain-containing protein n=1 Tax=Rhodoferax sp. BLA1 TaxID=2576062 RepID=UPI0015D0E74D|nr:DUF2971 domain-containing protein [Rhodoferax sp. BLA1]
MTDRLLVNFKYRSGAAALRGLSDGACYFAHAGELNDSLEAKFAPADPFSYARTLAQTLTELAIQRKEPAKYEPEEESAEYLSKLIREEDQTFAANCQRVGIFSGTKRPDNQPMWAYYCNDGRGVCFEFEWPRDVIEQFSLRPTFVHYTDQPRVHDRFEDMRAELLAVGDKHPDWTVEQLHKHSQTHEFIARWMARSMSRAVSIKHSDWAHEHELRMLSPKAGPLPILRQILKRVYFTRTDFPEWGPIMMLLHQLYP